MKLEQAKKRELVVTVQVPLGVLQGLRTLARARKRSVDQVASAIIRTYAKGLRSS